MHNRLYCSLCFLFFSCDNTTGRCFPNYFENITNFEVVVDKISPAGIKVDSGGFSVDLVLLDSRIKRIENCILQVVMESKIENNWGCLKNDFHLYYDCLIIKIVSPVFSSCSSWQFIGVKASAELCLLKEVIPTEKCPCMWRSAIQDDNVIITPPALYLWDVGRVMTSCNNIWYTPLAKCLMF